MPAKRNPLRVAFITHGGPMTGLGHIRRCLALARGLAERGADSTFLVSPERRLVQLVEASGFTVREIAWEADASSVTLAVRAAGADWAVVDTYGATSELFDALHACAERLVAVDDAAERPFPVDVIVNGSVGAEGLTYQAAEDAVLLLGAQYALIESKFAAMPDRKPSKSVNRILITLGGSVQLVAAGVALAAARSVARDAVVDVLLGPYAEATGLLDQIAADGRVNLHGHVHEVQPLMLRADVAITSAGMTLYELAASATPCIMLMTAANQSRNVQGFQRAGAALVGGSASSTRLRDTLEAQLGRLVADARLRAALGSAARRLVDGLGARRGAGGLTRLATGGDSR